MNRPPPNAPPMLCRRSRRFLFSMYASIFLARNAGRRLVIACEMRFRSSPQPRQNFISSLFWIPHFGQYICLSDLSLKFAARVPIVSRASRLVFLTNSRVKVPGSEFGDARRRLDNLRSVIPGKLFGRPGRLNPFHPVSGQAVLIHHAFPDGPKKKKATENDRNLHHASHTRDQTPEPVEQPEEPDDC